jgi:hypothetical protein
MWMALATAGFSAALLGDQIPLHQGFGFEGFSVYKPITQHLLEHVRQGQIDSYTIQRLLPFVVAHYTIRALGLPLSGPHILGFFQVLNAAVLAVAAWLWLRVARDHQVSPAGQWLGFIGLFVNFAAMKLPFYYPVNLDTIALLLGLVSLYAYRRDSLVGLLFTGVIGIFVWPTQVVVVSLLLLLPKSRSWPERLPPPAVRNRVLILLFATLVVAVLAHALYGLGVQPASGGAPAVRPLLPLSLGLAGAYLYLGLLVLAGPLELLTPTAARTLWSVLTSRRLLAVAALATVHGLAIQVLAAPGPPRLTFSDYVIKYISLGAAARPAQFLVAHVAYFGPILLVALLRWPSVAHRLRGLGAGLVGCAGIAVILGVNSESRQLVNFLPLLVLPAVLVSEEEGLTRPLLPGVAAFAVLFSKVWLPINYAVSCLGEEGARFPNLAGRFLEFPAQAYFMNFGPWMSNATFVVHAAAVLVTGAWVVVRARRAADPAGPSGSA